MATLLPTVLKVRPVKCRLNRDTQLKVLIRLVMECLQHLKLAMALQLPLREGTVQLRVMAHHRARELQTSQLMVSLSNRLPKGVDIPSLPLVRLDIHPHSHLPSLAMVSLMPGPPGVLLLLLTEVRRLNLVRILPLMVLLR